MPIEKVLVNVHYPDHTEIVSQYGYQGNRPAKEFQRGSTFEFRDILPNQEITIAQAFSKGTVDIPLPRLWRILINGYIITLLFYIICWFLWGKDPKPKAIVPSWEIPQDLTPLECAYIENNGNEPKNSFFIHILWLISKHVIKVIENDAPAFLGKKKIYTLTTVTETQKNHPEMQADYPEIRQYCERYPNILTLTDTPSESLTEYNKNLNENIRKKLENHYYFKGTGIATIGALIIPIIYTICFPQCFTAVYILVYFTLTLLTFLLSSQFVAAIATIGILIIPIIYRICFPQYHEGFYYWVYLTLTLWPVLLRSRIVLAFFTLCAGISILIAISSSNPLLLGSFCLYVLTIFVFTRLMFQPSIPGQRKKEQIEGIKMFLKTITNNKSISQQNDINVNGLNMGKRLTPLDMENLFPYAVALGLEKAWSQKFADMFGNAALASSINAHKYYRSDFRKNISGYCQNVTKFSRAAAVKSSGDGSFGGGYAGGGFGGGGGRGR